MRMLKLILSFLTGVFSFVVALKHRSPIWIVAGVLWIKRSFDYLDEILYDDDDKSKRP